ncbi:MAG: hypothetical protein JWR61_1228 [Ferruginibacter sp.]|uniref:CHAT domain-containing protein n=1 Tax=Ferruginibacter sp. TaxID=1940288 RepID=UPI0026591C42|nr:CHAT domain-containing protein [Ferruginibacter sp.]MDB5276273.1 hypothetical protein [Ferruginibacter sp.]
MKGNTVKQTYYSSKKSWLISMSFVAKKCRHCCALFSFLFFIQFTSGQCPSRVVFYSKINTIYISKDTNTTDKLTRLQQLIQQMQACKLEKDSVYMFLLQKISILFFKQQQFSNAINFANQSLGLAKQYIKNKAGSDLAVIDNYYNLTFYYQSAGEPDKKYAATDSCIYYCLKANTGFEKAVAGLSDKTDYLFNTGEYGPCITNAEMGEALTKKYFHGKDSIAYLVSFIINKANSLYYSKNIVEAATFLETKMKPFVRSGNKNQLYAFYSLLASINRDQKNYSKALDLFKLSFQIDSLIKFNNGCAQNLIQIGKLYAKAFGQINTGLSYCSKALEYAGATDSMLIFAETGNIYVQKKMFDKAQYAFQQAYNIVQPGMDETSMLKNTFRFPGFNQLQYLSDLTTSKGDAFVQEYYTTKDEACLKKAIAVYKKNDLFLTKIKTEQQLQISSSLVWRATARNLYEHAIDACYANNNIEDAFYFFEKSRATLLNDQVKEQQWTNDSDIAKLTFIKRNIIALRKKLNGLSASSENYSPVQSDLYNSSEELTFLSRKLKMNNPIFYQHYLDTSFMNIAELRKSNLGNTTSLLEIFSGDSSVYLLTISSSSKSLIKINQPQYNKLVDSFNRFITNPELLNNNFATFIKIAHQLYGLLFPENTALPKGSLIISPDGKSFPFEALVTSETGLPESYLLNQFAISYAYSVKYLNNTFSKTNGSTNKLLGIAPVSYHNYAGLTSLSRSDISLKNINTYFSNATNYITSDATKKNFLANFTGYTIIQLYTHASGNSSGNDPVIYFADSSMLLSELITDRKPITQLVVLSACETADGILYEGEGIFSFNRGFAALGIPAAVSTLWSVENESTYKITELFYKYLAQELPTDIALQKAKLEFISTSTSKEKTLPYYWAGPILTGKVDTIIIKKPTPWKTILIAGIALLAGAITTKKYLLNKKNRG